MVKMLDVKLCGIELKNPTILASGILGVTKESVEKCGKGGAGGVTLKSLCHEERQGNPNPTMFGFKGGFINAVGLPGQGIDNASKEFVKLNDLSIPVIGSIYGYKISDFGKVAKKMDSLKPAMIEVDISCPHLDALSEYYDDPKLAGAITKIVKKNVSCPVSIKLSPDSANIVAVAKACEKAGADCITAINTAKGMVIDADVRRPVLSHKTGGISGAALKPIALRCVYEIYKNVKIPIIGTGGVSSGRDAIEMIMAGATCVGIGTAVYYDGVGVFSKVCKEMEDWMVRNNVKSLESIRGCAHVK
jgi:dihydroorotate dehydrogenase (NAD+) catalytic subunit